jgi:hypothetical protein
MTTAYTVVPTATIRNVVAFANDSELKVSSKLEPDETDETDPKRFNFAFDSCSLKWRGFTLPLPPVGRGWGDLCFLDDDLRVQRDSRGDILIARRSASSSSFASR